MEEAGGVLHCPGTAGWGRGEAEAGEGGDNNVEGWIVGIVWIGEQVDNAVELVEGPRPAVDEDYRNGFWVRGASMSDVELQKSSFIFNIGKEMFMAIELGLC